MIIVQLIENFFSIPATPDQAVHPQDPQMVRNRSFRHFQVLRDLPDTGFRRKNLK